MAHAGIKHLRIPLRFAKGEKKTLLLETYCGSLLDAQRSSFQSLWLI